MLFILSSNKLIAKDLVTSSEESPPPLSNSNYPASFFEQYLPQNALEMIGHLPGFNFDQGSSERGFGGNAGNVIIDGSRPTSKSGGLQSALKRIPASQVSRIEILRGGVSSGEASGQSIVANVIRKKSVTSGSWAFKERWPSKGKLQPNLEASITTGLGDWNTSFDIDVGSAAGYRTSTITNHDADGLLINSAKERQDEGPEFLFINGEGAKDFTKGKLTLNARVGGNRYTQETDRDIYDGQIELNNLPDKLWHLDLTRKFRVGEIGIDWNQSFNDWRWHVIAISLQERKDFRNHLTIQEELTGQLTDNAFEQEARTSEQIFRSTFGLNSSTKLKPEYGFELAKNKLNSKSISFMDGIQQSLNGGDVKVEEIRGEIFASFIYGASDKLTLAGGLTTEFSTIEVSGDAKEKQSFTFLKPRFSATYKFNQVQQLTLELERSVGQLNFNDFAASSQATDDRTTSGNPNLSPDKTNELSLTYDWSFSKKGSFKIKAFYQQKEDILEQIILPSGGQGLGNAGDAEFWGILTDLNIPLDFILDNGLIEISHVYQDSNFDDPVIKNHALNKNRAINNFTPNQLNFTLRQDIVDYKFAWGVEYLGNFTHTNYFVDEIIEFSGNNQFRVFIESSQFFGVKIQLEVTQINTAEFDRQRSIFNGDRAGSLSNVILEHRLRRPKYTLTFSKNF